MKFLDKLQPIIDRFKKKASINIGVSVEDDNCKFTLKKKYNGVKCVITKRPCRNGDLTKGQAENLIKKHPLGVDLFEVLPNKYKK